MADLGHRALVVFDFDGTLADTWRDIESALNRTLQQADLPLVKGPDVRFWIGEGVLQLLEQAVPELHRSPEHLNELYTRFRRHYAECCLDTTELYPGIAECLEELSDSVLAIVSNKPVRFLDRIIEGLKLKSYFTLVLGGDSLDVKKPDPRVFKHVLSRLGETPSALWMVGDSAIDVETGRMAGARTVGCAWGLRGRQELRDAGVDVLIDHPREIPQVVYGRR